MMTSASPLAILLGTTSLLTMAHATLAHAQPVQRAQAALGRVPKQVLITAR
jgi:hypothetical protein